MGSLVPTGSATDPERTITDRFNKMLIQLTKDLIRSPQSPIRIVKTSDPGGATTDPTGNNLDLTFNIFDQECCFVDRVFLSKENTHTAGRQNGNVQYTSPPPHSFHHFVITPLTLTKQSR